MIALLQATVLASAMVAAEPRDDVAVDRVDVIEMNHYYDENGKPVFRQLIFYDWSAEKNRFDVRAWRLIKKPDQVPIRVWNDSGEDEYLCIWEDGDTLRKVVASRLRKTWTQYDPELIERASLPKEERIDLMSFTPDD